MDPYGQAGCRLRFARGRRGAAEAARRGDVLVVVDVLSFCSLVATAVARGAAVVPCRPGGEAAAQAAHPGAIVAVRREQVPALGRYSLSPPTLDACAPGEVVVVGSPNGAACAAAAAAGARAVFAGSLLSAGAVARAAAQAAAGEPLTVLACGERWAEPDEDGAARPALEDDLGAGAVLLALGALEAADASAEARAVAAQYATLREQVAALVWDCASGRELRQKGFDADVRWAARPDAFGVAPRLVDGAFRA